MEENLITKKELLEITGISYGALYRWKRMKLLPDEWFIHRSTFTGHETFFPRDKVLERVAEIQRLKESMSLDEIARLFQPGPPGEVSLTAYFLHFPRRNTEGNAIFSHNIDHRLGDLRVHRRNRLGCGIGLFPADGALHQQLGEGIEPQQRLIGKRPIAAGQRQILIDHRRNRNACCRRILRR